MHIQKGLQKRLPEALQKEEDWIFGDKKDSNSSPMVRNPSKHL